MSAWVLPDHIADVLPSEARHIEELRRGLLDTARGYGYELVMPPMLEYLESLLTGTGEALDLQTCKLIDQLTGRTITIDGVTLDETQFEYTETDDAGTVLRQARGNEYISREFRMFFSGSSEWDDGNGNWLPMDSHPIKFFRDGDKGFESTQPIFDCDAILSQNSKEGLTHDQL